VLNLVFLKQQLWIHHCFIYTGDFLLDHFQSSSLFPNTHVSRRALGQHRLDLDSVKIELCVDQVPLEVLYVVLSYLNRFAYAFAHLDQEGILNFFLTYCLLKSLTPGLESFLLLITAHLHENFEIQDFPVALLHFILDPPPRFKQQLVCFHRYFLGNFESFLLWQLLVGEFLPASRV